MVEYAEFAHCRLGVEFQFELQVYSEGKRY
jgi:hypothetical protein